MEADLLKSFDPDKTQDDYEQDERDTEAEKRWEAKRESGE